MPLISKFAARLLGRRRSEAAQVWSEATRQEQADFEAVRREAKLSQAEAHQAAVMRLLDQAESAQ